MKYINSEKIKIDKLPGRGLRRAVGDNSHIYSNKMSVGFALYNESYGKMEPHNHTDETVIITKCLNGRVRWGDNPNKLENVLDLEEGMILYFPAFEWHVFEYDNNGFIEIIYIYGETENIRPEDN